MIKWEYKFAELSILTDECTEELSELGNQGWEVIKLDWYFPSKTKRDGAIGVKDYGIALLKRPKADFGSWPICCGPLPETVKKHEHGD